MKKVFAVFSAVSAILFQVAYAVNANGESSLSQLEIIDYVVLAGIIILALGMLLVILSMFMRVKNKNEDLSEEYSVVQKTSDNCNDSETYDENTADDEGILDDEEADDSDLSVSESSDTSGNSEASENSDSSEESDISDSAGAENKADDITDSADSSENNASNTVEDNAEKAEEDEAAPPESEKIVHKARVSFTGQNNSDVKFVEFSKSATIGRRNTNDLIISDKAVSGNHCELTFADGKVYIEDMNSTNGTFIDGERISRKELKSGDVIILGKMSFKVNILITE